MLSYDDFVQSTFAEKLHQKVLQYVANGGLPKVQPVQFPQLTMSVDGDSYFENLWKAIDSSNDYLWMVMYHFDDTRIGKITLHKLSEAAKRGVNVCILHDILTSELDSEIVKEFRKNGGLEYRLNSIKKIWNYASRYSFKRDHEKLVVSDGKMFLGSANISVDYARMLSITKTKNMEAISFTI